MPANPQLLFVAGPNGAVRLQHSESVDTVCGQHELRKLSALNILGRSYAKLRRVKGGVLKTLSRNQLSKCQANSFTLI